MEEEVKLVFANGVSVGQKTIPVAHLRYTGSERTYIVWCITQDKPVMSADDEDYGGIGSVDVDIYSEGNYTEIVRKVKQMMKQNGFLWVEDSVEMYEEDTELYHKTISFEKERYYQ